MIYYNVGVNADTLDDAFEHWYKLLTDNMNVTESRDGNVVGEVINAVTVINDPTHCIMKSDIRKLPMRYCVGEMLWYLSANNSLKEIQKYTKNWDRMSDDGETVNSNYGYCIKKKFGFDQWEYVKSLLIENPNSRQAVIHIKTADNTPSKDVNCTVCLQFFIRDNKLYLTVYMRSNDLWTGFPYDVFQFTAMQILMSMELGLELGSYTHIDGSLHLYERNI
jgi:thymidylate synthase